MIEQTPNRDQPAGSDDDRDGPANGRVQSASRPFLGPLPDPHTLARYGEIVDNGVERLFRQWERESEFRRSYEQRLLLMEFMNQFVGKVVALVFCLFYFGFVVIAVYLGQERVASVSVLGGLAALVFAMLRTHPSGADRSG